MVAHEEHTSGSPHGDDLEDVVVVTAKPDENDGRPSHPAVTSAVRYLLNRHDLTTGEPVPQMIAVVSALGGEGVTTVSRSLAGILSSASWSNVCWMDLGEIDLTIDEVQADAPALSRVAKVPPDGRADRSRPARRTSSAVGKQSSGQIVTSGGHGTLALPEFEDLLTKLADEYRHVIFDTPPLLSEPDALGFMRYADAYILVTRHGFTTRADIRKVTDELRTISSLGAILNDYRTRTPKTIRRLLAE